jgi:phage gpG-like protein
MATFNDLDKLIKQMQKDINDSMKNDVAPDMVKVVQDHVEKDVYNAYTPLDYQRTNTLKNNVNATTTDNTIEIDDTYIDNGKDIVDIVETGKGYTWGYTRNLDDVIGARPFMELADQDIKDNQLADKSLIKSLKSKGYDVK